MKKPIALIAAALFLAAGFHKAEAQSFEQGNVLVSAGYGFGNFSNTLFKAYKTYGGFESSSFGPAYLKGEYAVSDGVGLGLNIAYITNKASYSFNDPTTGDPYTASIGRTAYSVLGRVNFHFANGDQIDPYFGLGAGYHSAQWKFEDNDPNYDNDFSQVKTSLIPIGFETTFGIRYYPMPMLGIYSEIGMAKSFLQLGVTYRIGAQ
jgi:hypothetical protein